MDTSFTIKDFAFLPLILYVTLSILRDAGQNTGKGGLVYSKDERQRISLCLSWLGFVRAKINSVFDFKKAPNLGFEPL